MKLVWLRYLTFDNVYKFDSELVQIKVNLTCFLKRINEDWEKLPAAKNGEWEHTLFSCCKIDWIGEFILALSMPCLYDCTVAGGIGNLIKKHF